MELDVGSSGVMVRRAERAGLVTGLQLGLLVVEGVALPRRLSSLYCVDSHDLT